MRFCGWGCLLRVLAVSPGPMSASPSVLAIRYCVMGGLLVMVVILGLEGWGNASGGRVGEFAEQIGGPVEIGGLEEMRGEAVRPVLGQDRIDALLAVGIGRTAERKRDRAQAQLEQPVDRKSVVEGKRGSVRVDLGGRRIIKKKKQHPNNT